MTRSRSREIRPIPKAGDLPSERKRPTLRLALARGSIAAIACVIAGAMVFAIWGGLFGYRPAAAIYGGISPPGLSGAIHLSILGTVFVGPMVALAGFVVAFLVTLVRSPLLS